MTVRTTKRAQAQTYDPNSKAALLAPEAWLTQILGTVDEDGRGISTLYVQVGDRRRRFRSILKIPVEPDAKVPDLLARIARSTHQQSAPHIRVAAFRDGEELPEDTLPWPRPLAFEEPEEPDDLADATTPMSAVAGLLRQAHNHNEHLLMTVLDVQRSLLAHAVEENGQLRAAQQGIQDERVEIFEMWKQIQIDGLNNEAQGKRSEALLTMGQQLAQAVALRIAQPQGGDHSPVGQAVGQLLQSLRPEQIQKLSETLDDAQMTLLSTIFETTQHGKKSEEEEKPS